MKYKLIAIDLDGTLLTDNKKLLEENKRILNLLNDMSVEIVIATGRRYWAAKNFVKELNMDLVVMANNGNIVRKIDDDSILVSKYLDKDDFYELIKKGKDKSLYPVIHVDHYDEGYDIIIELDINNEKYSKYMHNNLERFRQIERISDYKNPKVLSVCYMSDYEILKKFENNLKNKFPNKYNSHIMNNTPTVGPILEIMNPLGSKWTSLKEYALDKGINIDEIIAIGDDNNDVDMIQNAGLGIGMKNCSQPVKKVADMITEKNNNEAGVASILKRIYNL
ncbi:MAG: Cof-type HAD-IIB family hydrolase [Firmicutes bacterium]|nr:Cof-type HAD-IIB family hydrolase [Bacillota bacterium]